MTAKPKEPAAEIAVTVVSSQAWIDEVVFCCFDAATAEPTEAPAERAIAGARAAVVPAVDLGGGELRDAGHEVLLGARRLDGPAGAAVVAVHGAVLEPADEEAAGVPRDLRAQVAGLVAAAPARSENHGAQE